MIRINYSHQLLIGLFFTTISLPISSEVTEGNLIASGTVQLQCWQYGTKIIDEKGLNQQTISSLGEPGFMRFSRGKESKNMLFLVPTNNATCIIKNEDR